MGRLGFFFVFFPYIFPIRLARSRLLYRFPSRFDTYLSCPPPSAVAIAYIVLYTSHTISWYTHKIHTRGIYTAHQPNLWVILYAAVYLHYTIPTYTYGCTRIITTVSRIRSIIVRRFHFHVGVMDTNRIQLVKRKPLFYT